MKRPSLNLLVGLLLMAVFVVLLFVFQVRQTEVAVVTTFGKATRPITQPGAYFKWPWPVQKVHALDNRAQNFESKFEETQIAGGVNLLISVYAGWSVSDPLLFFSTFENGSVKRAEETLDGLIRSAKNAVAGQHAFSHFVSTNRAELKLADIEAEILKRVQADARANYGVEVKFLGIKRLGIPESNTQTVFKRMEAERQRLVKKYQGEGDAEASRIRSTADAERDKLLAEADGEATRIRGEADAAAAKSFEVFQQNPELAVLLLKLNALEGTLKERATLILDQRTPPFDLLNNAAQPKK